MVLQLQEVVAWAEGVQDLGWAWRSACPGPPCNEPRPLQHSGPRRPCTGAPCGLQVGRLKSTLAPAWMGQRLQQMPHRQHPPWECREWVLPVWHLLQPLTHPGRSQGGVADASRPGLIPQW